MARLPGYEGTPSDGVARSTKKPRKSRGRGLRTSNGCAICRHRHMKCDEVKPTCGACRRSNRACTYGPLPSFSGLASTYQRRSSISTHPVGATPQDQRPGEHTRFSPMPQCDPSTESRSQTPGRDNRARGTDTTHSERLDSLATVAANPPSNPSSSETLGNVALARSTTPEGQCHPCNATSTGETRSWQEHEPVVLSDEELDILREYAEGISLWIDLFDPLKHFSTFVPHLALRNTGLMRALLALGARHASLKSTRPDDASRARNAAIQYYYETLQHIQSAMHFTSYKNSPELLATIVLVSTFEMIDAAGKDWERHLKGAFWIQRCREINGESGGFEGAVWWAWLRQDVWAAFREHRRCFSFFRPTLKYEDMTMWDMASRAVYILAQAVNYSSDEERAVGEQEVDSRVQRAATLMYLLDEWRRETGVQFTPLSVRESNASGRAFKPIWIHPSALGTSLQMYCMARILVLANQPAGRGPTDHHIRTTVISQCIDTIGGIATMVSDDASRYMSTQCLLAAGVYCTSPSKLESIADLIREQSAQTGWPDNSDLTDQMRSCWEKHNP